MIEKAKNFAKNFMTMYAFIAIMFTGMAWASDQYHQQFLKKSDFESIMTINENARKKDDISKQIANLNNEIADLKIERKYARAQSDKLRIDEKIIRKEAQIKNLKGE